MLKSRKITLILAVGIALAIGGGAYAFTASNTVPATTAGAGAGAVTGYTVTNIHYVLDATTPTNIDSLAFTISPAVPSASGRTVTIAAWCRASAGRTTTPALRTQLARQLPVRRQAPPSRQRHCCLASLSLLLNSLHD